MNVLFRKCIQFHGVTLKRKSLGIFYLQDCRSWLTYPLSGALLFLILEKFANQLSSANYYEVSARTIFLKCIDSWQFNAEIGKSSVCRTMAAAHTRLGILNVQEVQCIGKGEKDYFLQAGHW